MAKRKFEFDESNYNDDWSEYRKNTKKKTKHRENSDTWKFNPRNDYTEDEYDDYEDDHKYKARDW